MTIEHGFLLNGKVLPGTEWITRDTDAWWDPTTFGARPLPKGGKLDLLAGHWTAGEAGIKTPDDDGPFVVRGMKSRAHPNGQRIEVGIHFVIGRGRPTDEFAQVWQTADPGESITIHIGHRQVYRRSIGVEVVSSGFLGPDGQDYGRPTIERVIHGSRKRVLGFFPQQLAAYIKLANLLVWIGQKHPESALKIPRQVPMSVATGDLLTDQLSPAELRSYSGAMEHFQTPGTRKRDAAGLLNQALYYSGWTKAWKRPIA